jgi:hypothetical protein
MNLVGLDYSVLLCHLRIWPKHLPRRVLNMNAFNT